MYLGVEAHLEFGDGSAMFGSQLVEFGSEYDQSARRSVAVGAITLGVAVSRVQQIAQRLLHFFAHLSPQLIHLRLTRHLTT